MIRQRYFSNLQRIVVTLSTLLIRAEGYGSTKSQCESLDDLKNQTNAVKVGSAALYCEVPSTCTSIDCLAYQGGLISPMEYGLSFENFCLLNSNFLLYWSFSGNATSRVYYNLDTSASDVIDVSVYKNRRGDKIAEEITIRTKLISSQSNLFIVQFEVILKVSQTTTLNLIPSNNLTFYSCTNNNNNNNLTTINNHITDAPMVAMTTPNRINSGRLCDPNEMGNCGDNEACRLHNDSFVCFCFDGYEFNSQQVCARVEPNDTSFNYNIIWGTLGGITLTIIIIIIFVIIIKSYRHKSRRYMEFDLTPHDPSLPDPPMMEA